MSLVQDWLPPSREHWELIVYAFQFFPLFTAVQWVIKWYPMGKTSNESKLNLPGKWAWLVMETVPTFGTMIYCMLTIPQQQGIDSLPWANWTMAGIYVAHYLYRGLLTPFITPSISPIHPLVAISAFSFNLMNSLSLGGWLAGYGPTTVYDWAGRLYYIEVGLVICGWGFLANVFHDEDLREIRRAAMKRQQEKAAKEGKLTESVQKLYMIPKNGLFHFILYPHYLCEWIEWSGYWMVGGLACTPARTFLINEIATMLPRAVQGRQWYIEKFGKERVGKRKAIIPGLL